MSNNLIGATLATFTVTLSAAVNEPVDVAWSTSDGTAKAGTDYEAANGVVTFLPGETAKQVQVTVYGQEDLTAPDKNFFIELSPPTNAVLGVTFIEVVITIDEEDGVAVMSLVVPQGKRGPKGDPGLSAYEHAVLMGYEGTVEQWMAEEVSASAAATRAEGFAADAAESAVLADQKLTATIQAGDTKIADMQEVAATVSALNNGQEYFLTQTSLLASLPTVATKVAKALDTKKVWFWQRTSGEGVTPVTGTWTDTGLSEIDQAKEYFDSSVPTINIVELYSASNNISDRNIDPANGSIRFVSNAQVNVFPITSGETYTLNSVNFADQYAVLAVSPNSDTTTGKTQTLVSLTTIDTETRTFVAPITGFAFLNVKWGASLDITATLTIKSTEFDAVVKIKDTNIRDELAHQRLDSAGIETVLNEDDLSIVYPNIYEISEKTSGFFVGTSGTLTANAGGELVAIPISPGHTYLIKSPQYLSSKIVGLSADSTVSNGKPITLRNLSATSEADVFQFTVTEADVFQFAFFTTRLDSQSYDVRSTVGIYEDSIPEGNTPYISKIIGLSLGVSSQAEKPLSRLAGKKVFALGDSITQGTEGGYIKYLEAAFGTMINNYGSSGGRASRVVDIITAGEGLPKRDSATEATVWPVKDFTDLACVTLMIGTNDSDSNISTMGSIDQLPLGKVQDFANPNDYWALFPNNYLCNIALTIEFIRWKAPKAEIHICTPPYRNQTGVSDETRITKLIPLLESVCRHYAVHLFYGTYECGIGYKEMSGELNVYSYDGVHFKELGNEVFGKFFAQKVLSFG